MRRGTATLADEELRFHTGRTGREGEDFFLHLRFDELTSIVVDGPKGTLTVSTPEHRDIVFHLGRTAVAWKELIDERPDLLRDLGVTPGARVGLEAIVDDELEAALRARVGELAPGDDEDGGLDVLFAGVEHRADLTRLAQLVARVRPGTGVVWLVYPERSRTLAEDDLVAAARAAGLVAGRSLELSPGRIALRLTRP